MIHSVNRFDKSFWRDRRVFVTGATGLVGGWLIRRLLEAEADVVCLVRDWTPHSELYQSRMIDRVTVVSGDLCDQSLIERALGEFEISTVIHLAAQTIVGIANRNPVSTFEANIGGTWKLLEACRRSPRVNQIIVASSDKAYGEARTLPYTEETPLEGRHPYDVSKSCSDLIAQSYAVTYGLPVIITRCGNFYGGGDLNWNRIIPGTIRSVFRNQRPVIRSDGSFVRDYFYVEDGAAAYMFLAEQLARRPELAGSAFNLSTEIQLSVLEIVQMVLQQMGSDLEPEVLGEACHEIPHQYLSARKARELLNWQPLFTLEEGLRRTIEWYTNYLQPTAKPTTPTRSVESVARSA
ncbi:MULTISPECIES: GDP-mannose 4,6-dehydratase [unclassified Schlesneria]|uniref:GDP-mannose 4,6-dehydratase n=1 Tax=unclassified Schlesneria TaxID=2762017 RepID=UPI002F110804